MAKAKKLPSGSWRCQVYSHTEEIPQSDGSIKKKRIYKSFTCDDTSAKGKRKCEQMAAQWAIEKESRSPSEDMLLNDAITSYIQSKENVLSEATITGYKKIQKNHIESIKMIRLSSFNKSIVQKWVNELSSKYSVKTVKNAYGLFSSTMDMFMDKRFKIQFKQENERAISIPSDDDIKLLLSVADGDLKLAIYLAAFGGLRRGEICALDSSDVFDNYISINKSMGLKQDRTWEIKIPKTASSNRNTFLPKFLIDMLNEKDGQIVGMTPDQVTDRFCCLRDKLSMTYRFHDLRHYYASINHALGIPDQYIMEMGGWKTDRTLKAVYRNTLKPEKDKFANISLAHFDTMQHEMQHEKKKVP